MNLQQPAGGDNNVGCWYGNLQIKISCKKVVLREISILNPLSLQKNLQEMTESSTVISTISHIHPLCS